MTPERDLFICAKDLFVEAIFHRPVTLALNQSFHSAVPTWKSAWGRWLQPTKLTLRPISEDQSGGNSDQSTAPPWPKPSGAGRGGLIADCAKRFHDE